MKKLELNVLNLHLCKQCFPFIMLGYLLTVIPICFVDELLHGKYKESECNCLLPCRFTKYDVTLTTIGFPSEFYAKEIVQLSLDETVESYRYGFCFRVKVLQLDLLEHKYSCISNFENKQ